MERNNNLRTYQAKVRLGIDDLSSFYNEQGEWQGVPGICVEQIYYLRDQSGGYDLALKERNNQYIAQLKRDGKYGVVVVHDIILSHNPLYDNSSKIENSTESHRIVFLDFSNNNKMEQKRSQEQIDLDIKAVKEQRVEIDKCIQSVNQLKVGAGIPEKILAYRKLQEAKMWLGQVLAELGAETPYPFADDPTSTRVEPTADVHVNMELPKGHLRETVAMPSSIIVPKVFSENIVLTPRLEVMVKSELEVPIVSIHFTTKDQSIDSIKVGLLFLVSNYRDVFDFKNSPVLHTFLPRSVVVEKGWNTDIHDELLIPTFGNLNCMYKSGVDLNESRNNMLNAIKENKGMSIFIGEIKDGVKEEYDLAQALGIRCINIAI